MGSIGVQASYITYQEGINKLSRNQHVMGDIALIYTKIYILKKMYYIAFCNDWVPGYLALLPYYL